MDRACIVCGLLKISDEFYDSVRNTCKECTKGRANKRTTDLQGAELLRVVRQPNGPRREPLRCLRQEK